MCPRCRHVKGTEYQAMVLKSPAKVPRVDERGRGRGRKGTVLSYCLVYFQHDDFILLLRQHT